MLKYIPKPLGFIYSRSLSYSVSLNSTGNAGSGAGKGGGSGGSIRNAGGMFGEIEAAAENVFFKKLEMEQIQTLKKHLEKEIKHNEKEIQRHRDNIDFHKKHVEKLSKLVNENFDKSNVKKETENST